MNTQFIELLGFGLVAVIAGIFLLVSMVRELAAHERRKWLLGIGLGTGIIAFGLKIGFIVFFTGFPRTVLEAFPERELKLEWPADTSLGSKGQAAGFRAYTWQALPASAPFPADNPPTAEKIALGKKLFFDPRLSADGTIACASCHELSLDKAGGDALPTSVGIDGKTGSRNAPTVLNAAFQRRLFWDGRAASLEEQAVGPLVNPVEMGMPSLHDVEQRVSDVPEYRQAFAAVFGGPVPINIDNIAKAIAAYERTLITPNSPYDRFVEGQTTALTQQQIRGMALFESTGCVQCHSGPNFSGASVFGEDEGYRVFPAIPGTGFEQEYRLSQDRGAANPEDGSGGGVWRIPSLRNVSRTGPYFHNGSVDSLEEAVRIMARVQLNKAISNEPARDVDSYWDARERTLASYRGQALSDQEIRDIVAFLGALSGELPDS